MGLVLLIRLAETWGALSATRSRIAKRDLIAGVLADAGPDDIEIVVSYLSGSLRQRRTGLGWRTLQPVPPPAAHPSLTVVEVDAAFAGLADLAGAGSASARAAQAGSLFARATETEQGFLRGLVFGDLRQGALDALVQEGLARAHGVEVGVVRRAAMLMSSTGAAARLLLTEGEAALAAVGLRVGTPVRPMLAASAPDPSAALQRSGLPAVVDHKLDGIRVQVHRQGSEVRVFTRSLEEITDRLPEVVDAVRGLAAERLVLDGEVLALRADGRPEAFQVIASRTASRVDVPGVAGRTPVRAYFFDLLSVDGADLLDLTLRERTATLQHLLPPSMIVPRVLVGSLAELTEVFSAAVEAGFEGVVVKRTDSRYAAGRREASWVKVKPRHTFDLVVTAAEWGHGRRQGWLSNLHLAARGADGDLVMLGKTFKGLTDELLAWQTGRFLELEERRTRGTVHVQPTTVVEIACDGLQVSSRYPGGVALRFARVLRYRTDKDAADADTLETVRRLLGPPAVITTSLDVSPS